MKKRLLKPILLLGLLMLTVIACDISFDMGGKESNQEDIEIQQTVDALQRTQTAAAAPPDDSQKSEDDQADQDSDADKDTGDDTPCNASKMVSETISDGTKFQGGETFTKSWTLRNVGDCDWTTDYKFVYESGDQMGGSSSMNVPSVVKPGESETFEIDMKAPSADGNYTGVWRLKAADGEKLGHYWVKITVGDPGPPAPPPAAFAVTSVQLTTPDTTIDAQACPVLVPVQAKITTSGPGTITYKWQESTGVSSVLLSTDFTEAGTKTVNYEVEAWLSDHIFVELYIDDPNNQWFGNLEIDVTCP